MGKLAGVGAPRTRPAASRLHRRSRPSAKCSAHALVPASLQTPTYIRDSLGTDVACWANAEIPTSHTAAPHEGSLPAAAHSSPGWKELPLPVHLNVHPKRSMAVWRVRLCCQRKRCISTRKPSSWWRRSLHTWRSASMCETCCVRIAMCSITSQGNSRTSGRATDVRSRRRRRRSMSRQLETRLSSSRWTC